MGLDAITLIHQLRQGCFMAKMDLKHAFRMCPLRREDWELLGMHLDNKFYVDKCLPFGLRSSPALFNHVAEALEWILINGCRLQRVLH